MSNHNANNDQKSNVRTSISQSTTINSSLSNAANSSSNDESKPIERKQADLAITKEADEILSNTKTDANSHAVHDANYIVQRHGHQHQRKEIRLSVPLCSAPQSSFYHYKPLRATAKRASSSRNKQRSEACRHDQGSLAHRESMYPTSMCLLAVLYLYAHILSICCADYMELGAASSCAVLISQDDAVKCWGWNDGGQLGQGDTLDRGGSNNTMGRYLSAIDFGAGFQVKFLSPSRGKHRCVISEANETKCIGWNNDGQLGYGDASNKGVSVSTIGDALQAIDLGDDFIAWKVGCGTDHTCSVSVANHVKCWGDNSYGQLGYNDTVRRGWYLPSGTDMGNNLDIVNVGDGFLVMDIAVGGYHTCIRSAAGTVKCWGSNSLGQLGYGDIVTRLVPGPEVDLGVDFFAVQLCAGGSHTCALSSAGNVACWGWNRYGQLGIESTEEMSVNPTTVDLGLDLFVVAITCGHGHNCALSDGGNIKCWGNNDFGQLGYNDTVQRGSDNNTMGRYLPLVDVGSDFVPKEVKCGGYHTCSTSQDDRMKCWGSNYRGQLGYEDSASPRLQMGDDLDVIDLIDSTLTPTTDPTTLQTTPPTSTPITAAPTAPSNSPLAATTLSPTAAPTQSPEEVTGGASDCCYKVISIFAPLIINYLHL